MESLRLWIVEMIFPSRIISVRVRVMVQLFPHHIYGNTFISAWIIVKFIVAMWFCWFGSRQWCYLVRKSFNYYFDFFDVWSWFANVDFIYSLDFFFTFLNKGLYCWKLFSCCISHSCLYYYNPSKKYYWCYFSYPWYGDFNNSLLNCSNASKNCSSSLCVNFKISLQITLVLCTGKYLFKKLVTICSHDVILLSGNVF